MVLRPTTIFFNNSSRNLVYLKNKKEITKMDQIINDIKEHLYSASDLYKKNIKNKKLQNDVLTLLRVVNALEVYEYGHKITDVWHL